MCEYVVHVFTRQMSILTNTTVTSYVHICDLKPLYMDVCMHM